MPRRRVAAKREVLPDPKFGSKTLAKFMNHVMVDGKKSVAEQLLYKALNVIRERTEDDPLKVFKKAVDNVKPAVEVKSRRVGGSTYQVPVEVRPSRRLALSMRWLIQSSQKRGEKTMDLRLANEFMDAAAGRGAELRSNGDPPGTSKTR